MSDNNYVDPDNIYPWVHPDDYQIQFGVTSERRFNIHTFDTEERFDRYVFEQLAPTTAEPGNIVAVRVNESGGKIFLWFAVGLAEFDPDSGNEIVGWVGVPLQQGTVDENGDGTPDSLVDGFKAMWQGTEFGIQGGPREVVASTLALDNLVRTATAPPPPEEPPNTQDVSTEAIVEQAAAPAAEQTADTQADAETAVNPNDTANPVGEAVNQTTTDLTTNAPAIESSISSVSPELATEFTSLQTELAAGNLTLPRTNEIMTQLEGISSQLPPTLAATATTINNAVGPSLNPGNIPGLEGIVQTATSVAGSLVPDVSSTLGGLQNTLNFAAGASLSDLSNLGQSLTSSLQQTTALLSGGNLLQNLPDINDLLRLDPTALLNNINLGAISNSINTLDLQTIAQGLSGGLMDVVDQTAAMFGTIGRGFPNNPALRDIANSTDSGFGYTGARGTSSGAQVRQTSIVTPEAPEGGPAPEGETQYERLIEVLERTLTQDWRARSGDGAGTPPSGQDPRGRDQIPPVPPGANPLIMEAYRISGQTSFTRDGVSGEYAWHTAFVNWVLSRSGLPIVASMSAQAYYSYGTRVNHTNLNNLTAQKGDIVIFNSRTGAKHIGFFWQYNAATRSVTILGGNQGGTVKLSNFPFSLRDGDFYVTHIRRNWDITPISQSAPQQNFDPRGNQFAPVTPPSVTPPGIYSTNPAGTATSVTPGASTTTVSTQTTETTQTTATTTVRGGGSTTTTRNPINEPVPLSPERARRRLQSQRLYEGRQYVVNGRVYTALRVGPLGQLDPNAQIKLIDEFDRVFG